MSEFSSVFRRNEYDSRRRRLVYDGGRPPSVRLATGRCPQHCRGIRRIVHRRRQICVRIRRLLRPAATKRCAKSQNRSRNADERTFGDKSLTVTAQKRCERFDCSVRRSLCVQSRARGHMRRLANDAGTKVSYDARPPRFCRATLC